MYRRDHPELNDICEQYIQKCHNDMMHFRKNFIKLEGCINDKIEHDLYGTCFVYDDDVHIYNERKIIKLLYDATDAIILSTNRNE
jgi:hypothetical protein